MRLVSVSQYLKKGITEFLPRWKANGWVRADGGPVLNQDLWDQLDQIAQNHEIKWEWIAGHGDHADQNRADQLGLQAARVQATRQASYPSFVECRRSRARQHRVRRHRLMPQFNVGRPGHSHLKATIGSTPAAR